MDLVPEKQYFNQSPKNTGVIDKEILDITLTHR